MEESVSKDCVCESVLERRYATSDGLGRGSTTGGVYNARALGNSK